MFTRAVIISSFQYMSLCSLSCACARYLFVPVNYLNTKIRTRGGIKSSCLPNAPLMWLFFWHMFVYLLLALSSFSLFTPALGRDLSSSKRDLKMDKRSSIGLQDP